MSGTEASKKAELIKSSGKKRKLIGFPGEGQGILAVPHYTGDKAHLNSHGPNGVPGLYSVEFVLARPNSRNSPEHEIKFANDLQGDSHLAIAKPAVIIDIDPDQILMSYQTAAGSLLFRGYPNKDGYLGKMVSDPFHATDRLAAQRHASTAIQGLLSNLSSQLDIPLIIEVVEVTELAPRHGEFRLSPRLLPHPWRFEAQGPSTTASSSTPLLFTERRSTATHRSTGFFVSINSSS